MCIVCLEWEKGKLTNKEALRNLGELINTDGDLGNEHYFGVIDKIMDEELKIKVVDEELDNEWWKETYEK